MASWWHGRRIDWNPDRQVIEQERQRWVYENLDHPNVMISELVRGPDALYAEHRRAYEETGDLGQLKIALEYVRA